jgi:raffinose/stachyose/melibiose transport system substrate-binding protein
MKRSIAAAAATVALGMSLAACSSGASSQSSANDLLTGASPTGVTLTMWHNTADSQALLDLYKAYEKASGNKIVFVNMPQSTFPTAVQTKWATGARPDILEWHGNEDDAESLNIAQNAIDLSSMAFVKKEGTLAQLAGNIDGKTYAASIGFPSVWGIFYNKKDFAKAGLSAPQTYADLASDCTVLKAKDAGVSPIYMAGGDQWPTAVLAGFDYMAQYNVGAAYDKSVTSGSAKLTDASGPFLAGMTAAEALDKSGCFNSDATTGTWLNSLKAVLNGSAAMVAQSSDSIAILDSDASSATVDANVGFAAVSATKSVANFSPTPLGTYYVPKTGNTTKEKAAIGFIKFITGAGYAAYVKESGGIPTLSGTAVPPLQELWAEVEKAYDAGAALTVNSQIPGFGNFGPVAAELFAGQLTAAQAASKMQAYYLQAQAAMGS